MFCTALKKILYYIVLLRLTCFLALEIALILHADMLFNASTFDWPATWFQLFQSILSRFTQIGLLLISKYFVEDRQKDLHRTLYYHDYIANVKDVRC